MADAGLAFGGLFHENPGEIVDAAGFLSEFESAFSNDTEAGRVVPAILQSAQAFEDDGLGGLPANVADNATHSTFLV
jgi:hypothetical protein